MQKREEAALTALLEDFKGRWQELLNFENENSRWSTLYVTALILSVSWFINNDRYGSLKDLFNRKENAYFIVSLALINAIYTLSMALKGYQIQQIALYLYSEVGRNISSITRQPFNSWEKWRREAFQSERRKGKPEWIRMIYYPVVGALPVAVSLIILVLYFIYSWDQQRWFSFRNLYFYVVTVLVAASGVTAISTAQINKRWTALLIEDR